MLILYNRLWKLAIDMKKKEEKSMDNIAICLVILDKIFNIQVFFFLAFEYLYYVIEFEIAFFVKILKNKVLNND